ncbi:MAG: lipid-A-disaccharide synthase [Flavobacteriaceae bacterium]|jgi:lipid-A-disaccharide synthase|nr:lipid-A-disaccharide synthase [Flavobacteriaceae bacterium]
MKYYIIAGEASGDLHGSNLMKSLKKEDPQADFRFWGGDLMQAQGGVLVKHYKDMAFMGFREVVSHLGTILGNIKFCKKDILQYQPDCVIFIDYPGFNLRICEFVKKAGIRTYYYISPQLWAWKAGRVKIIQRFVDKMFVILPFEKDFYADYHYPVDFVGHPLLDALNDLPELNEKKFRQEHDLTQKPIIALLPGSRQQEIKKMLAKMLSIEKYFPDYEFVIAGAPSVETEFYQQFLSSHVKIVSGQTYNLLRISQAALVTSGTATLETALLDVPEVVCYKSSRISYEIAKRLIKHISYISLVNLIMDRLVVTELIQNDLSAENLKAELKKIINPEQAQKLKTDYAELRHRLGASGASEKTAELITEDLKIFSK